MQPNSRLPPSSVLLFILLFFFFLTNPNCYSEDVQYDDCEPLEFDCGGSSYTIKYPFGYTNRNRASNCSYPGYNLTCEENALVAQSLSNRFRIKSIDYEDHTLNIVERDFIGRDCQLPVKNGTIDFIQINLTSPSMNANSTFFLFNYTDQVQNLTLYNCSSRILVGLSDFRSIPCPTNTYNYLYFTSQQLNPLTQFEDCSPPIIIPLLTTNVRQLLDYQMDLDAAIRNGFEVTWIKTEWCDKCERSGGRCFFDESKPYDPTCLCRDEVHLSSCPGRKKIRTIAIAVGVCGGFLVVVICVTAFLCYRKKQRTSSTSKFISRTISSDPSYDSELGKGNSILPTHVFSYQELQEATNNFDESKQLGEGGFGTVYHGKLRDGRTVAVKRLYESNYRRVEQFMNEVEILSRLRHPNLVSLYGCTSRHSRELLLVYEFVPNGTVADHIHGDHAKSRALTWPIRMSIAIESADALAYLHAVDIIHRDVKTNNILLDTNFHVKVADFGLSRLFPLDKTHVSTAPQGTPGYVDPDYHRCYQLNDKSDVYSFGVVLFELVSSKPAVDITRHRHEINLSNMAITKIQNHALHELVDPSFGFETDSAVRREITLVAELAFRCLHDEKDIRPSMDEVFTVLREIQSEKIIKDKVKVVDSQMDDDAIPLKEIPPLSPNSVTMPWVSSTTTPNTSG